VDSPLRRAPATARRARTAAAALGARAAAWMSRRADFGDGTAIGGRVAMTLDPRAISLLSQDIPVAMVSATNGKSTAATMLAAALSTAGPVAFNSGGSNMREGVAMALSQTRRAGGAVLEVDEMVLGRIARETGARWVVLMNASREYTRGVSLERTLDHWAATLADPALAFTVVANADDPVIAEMAVPLRAAGRVVWVAGGMEWRRDSVLCRRCGSRIEWPDGSGPDWACTGCDLTRPAPDWFVDDGVLHGPAGARVPLTVTLPGRWLVSNATFAVATAVTMGVPLTDAARAVAEVSDVDGRYRAVDLDGRSVRLFLVKNPASWLEAVSLAGDAQGSIVLAMETFSMRDLTPGWDVDLSVLSGATVVVTGQRRLDVAVMLEAADVPYTVVEDPVEAILAVPPGPVHVIANYTAFKELRRRLTA
jgi:lipid II isoglutaminyl synthase (glutamine-hydrolysing)